MLKGWIFAILLICAIGLLIIQHLCFPKTGISPWIALHLPAARFSRQPNLYKDSKTSLEYRYPYSKQRPNCSQDFRDSHYLHLEFCPGNTGNALIQVFALLATSYEFCYTPLIAPTNKQYKRAIDPVYDIKGVKREALNTSGFVLWTGKANKQEFREMLASGRYNVTLMNRNVDYRIFLSQEQFIRSSISFRTHWEKETREYLNKHFISQNRSPVAIHIRRTDRIGYVNHSYVHSSLDWYKDFIEQAIDYMESKYDGLSFILVSDDLEWCRTNIRGPNVYYSPFKRPGGDLALMSRCDHVILTLGTFGWCGAILGKPRSVVFSKTFGMPRFLNLHFFLPHWIGLEQVVSNVTG